MNAQIGDALDEFTIPFRHAIIFYLTD